ncbi:sulfite reductase (NADPH) flavoprotein alpha-component [Paenibacillus forsythiae]|uniref:Sulfite reductase (NADPH) flavoprotein alpha-component n=3 Tax=Paenibacillus forsythiae TaxID=365616 RepID=A0ABU3HF82_9BACL|nr:bifunctional nitrate reductase/sulfite reductase flavoprotein subunit alpha [Paenibacillus forsythiae]MDT3429136.1 sulfite reductase (NADPH) flavoprotein alpha-component [Paenibacillus forsythiae]
MTTKKVKSVCPYCGVGCGIVLEVSGNRVVKLTGDKEHPANFGRLCTKGSTAALAIAESGRMEYAYTRQVRTSQPAKVSIDAAISETARRLRAILDEHGPDALSFYVSGQMSLEAQYLVNKLAKGFIRTNNIESNSRLCMASAGSGYKLSLGADGPPGSYQDMDRTDLFFVIGANMADCHPILFLRLMDRVKAGAKLIVVDPRRTATAEKAHLFMQIRPGTDLALLNGLLHLLVKNGHTDPEFIAGFTSGFGSMPEFLEDYPPDKVAEITGIPEADIRTAAEWIGAAPNWMTYWTMGLNQSTHGTWHTNAICNLHLATGAICRPGSGPFSLTGQPNAMGGREMGYMGPGLPGQRSVLDEADRRFIEEMWKVPQGTLRTEVGNGTVSMFESMKSGDIKACWIICTNPVATVPNRKNVIAGLEAAELVIAQDAFLDTETNRFADILLPGALWSEGEGVMINSERNLTLMQKAVDPPGEALPDWQIIARVACEMGYSEAFAYGSPAEVYREIQQAWNPKTGYDLRGATYERLRETPVQWPAAPGSPSDRNPIRYLNGEAGDTPSEPASGRSPRILFPTPSGKGIFWARPYLPPAEMPDSDYPFVLNSGRLQHQWHTLTKTGKIQKLNKLNPGPFIEIHPDDAAMLGIKESDSVEIRSSRGRAVLPAVLSDRVRPGNCFAPFHWNDRFGANLAVNDVTSDAVDPLSLQPELKYCSVSLVKAAALPLAEQKLPDNHEIQAPRGASAVAVNPKEALYMAQLDTLESMLGLQSPKAVTLDHHEQAYLSGFIASLRTGDSQAASGVPVLPPAAPLEPIKRYWVDGLLAGMFSRSSLEDAAAASNHEAAATSEAAGRLPVTILWASQTGNAEGAAIGVAKKLQKSGHDIKLVSMDQYSVPDLAKERFVLFIASTFGAGDPPDNGERFFHSLRAEHAPRLPDLQYAVLAFGDSNYDLFCGFGRNLDARLEELGAQRLLECAHCDTDFEEQVEMWMNSAAGALSEYAGDPEQPLQAAAGTGISSEAARPGAADPIPEPGGYNRNRPLPSRILFNRLLNAENSEKETRHYAFDLGTTGLRYESGDALGVWPTNCPELVGNIVNAVNLEASAPVTVKGHGEMPIAAALLHHFEIARVAPEMLRFIRDRAHNERLNELLQSENQAKLKDWLWGRQLVDVLREFPVSMSAAEFTQLLKPLQPRLYSISSSPKANPDEVHITVSTIRYDYKGNQRKGVCSTFLADLATEETEIPIFIQKNAHFRPPANPDAPMIMVGPGTGIAPFRGFLQERQATGARGKNWLIFGEQREACDFYFRDELEVFRKEGFLHRLDTAFSRDQDGKIYVQHRMIKHGAELWAWLQEGAHFYVCGDASQMAKEVDAALRAVIQRHGGMTTDEAKEYVTEMSLGKRYQRDVY